MNAYNIKVGVRTKKMKMAPILKFKMANLLNVGTRFENVFRICQVLVTTMKVFFTYHSLEFR